MVSSLKLRVPHQIALAVCLPAGAIAGVAFGYCLSEWTWGMLMWVTRRADAVLGWAALGGVLAGAAAYGVLALAGPRQGRGKASAAPERRRSRTQPPRAENTSSTSSRRGKERTGGLSLQQALQGTGSTSWRA